MIPDPFDEAGLGDIDPTALLRSVSRSMMWEFIPPKMMQENPEDFGQTPASIDVLKAEYKDSFARRMSLIPLEPSLSILATTASNAASTVLLELDPNYKMMSEKDRMLFREHNMNLGTAVTKAVLGHLIQEGLIHYGEDK